MEKTCTACGKTNELDPEGLCRKCQGNLGFRYCSACERKKLKDLDFYQGRSECRDCSGARKRRGYRQCRGCGLHQRRGAACTCPGCPESKVPAGKGLRCRHCRRTHSDLPFYSVQVCLECSAQTADVLLEQSLARAGEEVRSCCQVCNELSRGGLCVRCRQGLEAFRHSPELLLRAASVVAQSPEPGQESDPQPTDS
jgi:hypothetical protein